MNQGKYVFSQITDFIPQRHTERMATEFRDRTKGWELTPWSQLMVLMYDQLEEYRNLRELTDLTTAHGSKYFHLGFGRLPETFFKWIMQHLHVKKLWGNSENAV